MNVLSSKGPATVGADSVATASSVAGALLGSNGLLSADAKAGIVVTPLAERYASDAIALLSELRVSLLAVCSATLHRALIHDASAGRIDCRVALEDRRVVGIVLAAPRAYWWQLPLWHWHVGKEVLGARVVRPRSHLANAQGDAQPDVLALLDTRSPSRTWKDPRDAWRIIFVGTAPSARGRGVAGRLYRDLMSARSLVARVDLRNRPSIRLHRSLGWQLYRDADVALAVYSRAEGPPVRQR